MIPLHPQACPGRRDRLRWIIPAGLTVRPGAILTDGTLASVRVEPGAVETTLGPGRSWAVDGPRVRSALHAALSAAADEQLRAAAADLIAGPAGDFVRGHGGRVELVGVAGGTVTVRLTGACRGCPAARDTLRRRFADELRRRCPSLLDRVTAAP